MTADQNPTGPAHQPASAPRIAERHELMVSAAAHRLARELTRMGCPMPATDLAERCGASHWSGAELDEAIAEAERAGWIRRLAKGWVAPLPARQTDEP